VNDWNCLHHFTHSCVASHTIHCVDSTQRLYFYTVACKILCQQLHINCAKHYTLCVLYSTHACLKANCTADVQLKTTH
jgi:hypothetical protein